MYWSRYGEHTQDDSAAAALTGPVVPMLGYVYFKDNKNTVPVHQSDTIKASLGKFRLTSNHDHTWYHKLGCRRMVPCC